MASAWYAASRTPNPLQFHDEQDSPKRGACAHTTSGRDFLARGRCARCREIPSTTSSRLSACTDQEHSSGVTNINANRTRIRECLRADGLAPPMHCVTGGIP